jgi:hypothetical protein
MMDFKFQLEIDIYQLITKTQKSRSCLGKVSFIADRNFIIGEDLRKDLGNLKLIILAGDMKTFQTFNLPPTSSQAKSLSNFDRF